MRESPVAEVQLLSGGTKGRGGQHEHNTTVPPGPPNNTTTPAGNVPSVTSSSATSPNTSNPNAGVCQRDTCGKDSSCVALNNTHFCLCVDGYYYKSSTCNKGKVFPGTIQLKVSETSDLENEKSVAYEKLHMEVINFFQNAFTNSDFGQTVIYKVRLSVSARSEMRADEKLVDVTVVNLFAETAQEDETTVNNKIEKAISSNSKTFTSYNKQDLCDFYGCIKTNDQDNCNSGLLCTCKPGLERPNPQTPSCLALGPKCSDDCRAEHNLQCVVRSNRSAACLCLPGYQKDQRGVCQACAFGYSGVNCEDKFELILTIVGTIAGILILGMLIALIFTRSKKKRGIEEQNLIENDFNGLRMQQTTDFSNLGARAGGSIFPKVRASVPTSSQMQNPYAQRGMPRPDY
ncbi:PREDICTED: mucin-13 [Miniopterus natalensis]|uniref:mucin-13 n=1 Tax=Miniopterus natalensis TaxID=291302 RepID=UPI0007A6E91F|nr:PREDICTED: mucin-13 [Miniopterus natalensis]